MNRAINVKIKAGKYAGTSYVLGGQKAGRFWSNSTSNHRRRKKASRGNLLPYRGINKVVFVGCLLFLAANWIMIYANNHRAVTPVKAETPVTVDSIPSRDTTSRDTAFGQRFESADLPKQPETIEEKITAVFGKDAKSALAIATCESGLNPLAHNYNPKTKDDSYGLLQINLWGNNKKNRPSPEVLTTVEGNINFAKTLFDGSNQTWSGNWKNCAKKLGLK